MPTYEFSLPSGQTFEVDSEHELNEEQLAYVASNHQKYLKPESNTVSSMIGDIPGALKGGAAAVGDILGGVAKIPVQAASAVIGKVARPDLSLNELYDAAGQSIEGYTPSFGSQIGPNQAYATTMKPVELLGKGIDTASHALSFGNKDVEGALRIASNFAPIPFAGKAKSFAKDMIKRIDPGLKEIPHDPVKALDDVAPIQPEPVKSVGMEQAAPIDPEYLAQRRAQQDALLRQEQARQNAAAEAQDVAAHYQEQDRLARQADSDRLVNEVMSRPDPEIAAAQERQARADALVQNSRESTKPVAEEARAARAQEEAQTRIAARQQELERQVREARSREDIERISNEQEQLRQQAEEIRQQQIIAAQKAEAATHVSTGENGVGGGRTSIPNVPKAEGPFGSLGVREAPIVEPSVPEIPSALKGAEYGGTGTGATKRAPATDSGLMGIKATNGIHSTLRTGEGGTGNSSPKRTPAPVNTGFKRSENPFGSVGGVPRGQRGGIDFDAIAKGLSGIKNRVTTVFDKIPNMRDVRESMISTYGKSEDILSAALSHGKDIKSLVNENFRAGMSNTSVFLNHPLLRDIGNLFQTAAKRTDVNIKQFVEPAQNSLVDMRKSSPKEYDQLYRLFMKEMQEGRAFTPDQLAQAKFTPEQIKTYQEIRSMFKQAAEEQNKVLKAKNLPELSEQDHYVASRRVGDHAQYFYDSKGRLVWMTKDLSKRQAESTAKWIHDNVPEVDKSKTQYEYMKSTGHVEDPAASFSSMILRFGDEPIAKQIKEAMLAKDSASAITKFGQQNHFKHKSGIRGFEGDRPWKSVRENADDMFAQQMHYAKNAFSWAELNNASTIASKVLKDEKLVATQPNVVKHANDYINRYMGRGEGIGWNIDSYLGKMLFGQSGSTVRKVTNSFKQLWTTQKMVTNSGNAVQNLIQPVNTLPFHQILSQRGFEHDAGKTFALTMADTLGGMAYHYGDGSLAKPLTSLGMDATRYAEDNHILSRSPYDEQRTIESTHIPVLSTVERVGREVNQATNKPANFAAFMSFVHHLDQSGKFKSRMELFQEAERWMNASMVDPRPGERPFIVQDLGSVGSLAYGLQSYVTNKFNSLAGFYNHAREQGGVSGYKPLMTAISTDVALAGVKGFIPVALYMEIANLVNSNSDSDWLPDMRNALMKLGDGIGNAVSEATGNEQYGQYAKDATATGIPGVIVGNTIGDRAMDLGPRFGGLPSIPGIGMVADVADQAKRVGKGVQDLVGGDTTGAWDIAQTLAPVGVAKGSVEIAGPYSSDKVNDIKPSSHDFTGYKRDATDKLFKAIGVPSLKENTAKESAYEYSRLSKVDRTRLDNFANNAARDLVRGQPVNKMEIARMFKLYPDQAEMAITKAVDTNLNRAVMPAEQYNTVKAKTLADLDRLKRVYGTK